MTELLHFRERLLILYKKYEFHIVFILKFISGMIIFNSISKIGLQSDYILKFFKAPFDFLLSLVFAGYFTLMPPAMIYFGFTVLSVLAISSSIEVAMVVFVVLLCIHLFYVRIALKESIFIIIMILAYYLKLPYIVPIIGGLYFGITTIIPISIGTFIFRMAPVIIELAKAHKTNLGSMSELVVIPVNIIEIYKEVISKIMANPQWIFEVLIFSMAILLISVISKLTFNYAKETAIILGGILCLVGFLISKMITSVNINFIGAIFGIIISVVLALVFRFFDIVLKYDESQKLEFQDEDYYYYVKAIPKMKNSQSQSESQSE